MSVRTCFCGIRTMTFAVVVLVVSMIPMQSSAQSETTPLPERRPESEVPKTATGSTSIPIRSPTETEVMQAERGVINPSQGGLSVPLEEPLDPTRYICGRGDTFELNFWGAQNFRLRVMVDLEGRTFLSKVGYVSIVGKTLAEARTIIATAVRRYYPGLKFDISLAVPRTFLVHVVGFVAHPGIYPSNPLQRINTLLGETGGVHGSRRRISIRRRTGEVLISDLVKYEFTGDTKYNPFLMDGDIVDVPFPQVVVSISGAVKRPGSYELIASKSMSELLELAGGLSPAATTKLPARIVTRDSADHLQEQTIPVPTTDTSSSMSYTFRDGDKVAIPGIGELQRSVLLIGPVSGATPADEVTSLRRIPFIEGATIRTIIEGAGAIGASADLRGSYIKRSSGAVVRVDLEAILVRKDFSGDRSIEMGDTIVIPQKRRGISVEGSVFHSGVYPFNPLFGPSEYIATAGGPTRSAQGQGSYRVVTYEGKIVPLSKRVIEPGDVVIVPEKTFSTGEIVSLVMGGTGILLSAFTLVYLVVHK